MKCPKCGHILKDNYCMKCGYLKTGNKEYQIKKESDLSSKYEKSLGVEYRKYIDERFNLGAFIFNNYYFLYKRFYLFGILISIINFINNFLIIKIINIAYSNIKLSIFEYYASIFRSITGPFFFLLIICFFRSLCYGLFANYIILFLRKNHKYKEPSLIPVAICIGVQVLALILIFYLYVNFGIFKNFI